jgi:hypothetical protein
MRRGTQIIGSLNSLGGVGLGVVVPPTAGAAVAGTLVGGAATAGANTYAGYGGFQVPDIVANLRVDQAWGSAQIMGALHQVNAGYYSGLVGTGGLENSGHPGDEWGWAIGGGLRLNTPYFGQGDYFQTQVNYTQGALRYLFQNSAFNWYQQHGASAAFGLMSDGVYGGSGAANFPLATATGVELTTGWEVNASYEHFWNPRWRTSLYGGYAQVSYNGLANAMLCSQMGFGGGGIGTEAVAQAGCDNDWNTWWLGSRTQWNVTKDFYIGLDVMYQKLSSMTTPGGLLPAGGQNALGVAPTTTVCNILNTVANGRCTISDEDNWSIRFRVHRDFYP